MPHHGPVDPALPGIFQALSDPTRVAVVERLSIGPASATELARPFTMALPSFLQHMGVLERAGIVTSHKTGRTRVFQIAPDALQLAAAWLATFTNHWERRLDQLDRLLVESESTSPTITPSASQPSHTRPSTTGRSPMKEPR